MIITSADNPNPTVWWYSILYYNNTHVLRYQLHNRFVAETRLADACNAKELVDRSEKMSEPKIVSQCLLYERVFVFQESQSSPSKNSLQQVPANAAPNETSTVDKSDFENKTPHKKFVSLFATSELEIAIRLR